MGFFSSIGDAVSSVVNTVGRAVSAAMSTAKDIAGRAIGWMAEKAEKLVGDVKNTWQIVKPYVAQIRGVLRAGAEATKSIPFLSAALTALEKGLASLTAFEKSPIAKKVDEAIKWAIKLAQRWQQSQQTAQQESEKQAPESDGLSEQELATAKRHQENLRFAEREAGSDKVRHELELAAAINDFEIAKADLALAIKAAPSDFEHYLRLRATQKLLDAANEKFRAARTVDDVSADDLFLIRIASDLIKSNPELNKDAALRLDRVLQSRFGQALAPFIFEELVASWDLRAKDLDIRWQKANDDLSKKSVLLKRLTLAKKIQEELSAEETHILSQLEVEVPIAKADLDELATQQLDVERYTGAAEGFLQLLEKSPEQIEAEDRGYLIVEGSKVGEILIACAKNETPFSALSAEQQHLVNDYANIFKHESKQRTERILKAAA